MHISTQKQKKNADERAKQQRNKCDLESTFNF